MLQTKGDNYDFEAVKRVMRKRDGGYQEDLFHLIAA